MNTPWYNQILLTQHFHLIDYLPEEILTTLDFVVYRHNSTWMRFGPLVLVLNSLFNLNSYLSQAYNCKHEQFISPNKN